MDNPTQNRNPLASILILSVTLIGLAFYGCGDSSTDPGYNENGNENGETPGLNEVWMQGQNFTPSNIEVEVGTTITWENRSDETHTVTSGSSGNHDGNFDSGNIAPGGEYSYTFTEVGEFDYYCIPHPNMTGTVTVVESSGSNGY